MAYKREELLTMRDASHERFQEVSQTLLNKLANNEKLSLAESKFICLGLKSIYSDDPNAPILNAENYDQCTDFLFWNKYLLYWQDLDGWGEIKDGVFTMSIAEKRNDVEFLNKHYEQWKAVISSEKITSGMLQTIASETNRLIKEVINYSRDLGEGSNRHQYIEKALVLHSKYLYYQVTEYYEENNPIESTIDVCGSLVVIDNFVYIHTLFGHFAADVKFNRPGKTYHRLANIDFRNIPKEILCILEEYSKHVNCQYFNKQAIFFNLKGTNYAIWFRLMIRSIKGGETQDYLRVQTYYPIELQEDINKIRCTTLLKVDANLGFYIKSI
jgi:hypothetical protein